MAVRGAMHVYTGSEKAKTELISIFDKFNRDTKFTSPYLKGMERDNKTILRSWLALVNHVKAKHTKLTVQSFDFCAHHIAK